MGHIIRFTLKTRSYDGDIHQLENDPNAVLITLLLMKTIILDLILLKKKLTL